MGGIVVRFPHHWPSHIKKMLKDLLPLIRVQFTETVLAEYERAYQRVQQGDDQEFLKVSRRHDVRYEESPHPKLPASVELPYSARKAYILSADHHYQVSFPDGMTLGIVCTKDGQPKSAYCEWPLNVTKERIKKVTGAARGTIPQAQRGGSKPKPKWGSYYRRWEEAGFDSATRRQLRAEHLQRVRESIPPGTSALAVKDILEAAKEEFNTNMSKFKKRRSKKLTQSL